MKKAILGKKLGMTQRFLPDGRLGARDRYSGRSLHRRAKENHREGRL